MNYIWKINWVYPYESLWSIIEKFKYVNVITNKELKTIFDYTPNNTSPQICKKFYIYRHNKFNEEKISNYFDLGSEHFAPLDILSNNKIGAYLNEELHYCPDCMKIGYHSYFHQFKFMTKCIFHNTLLIKAVDDQSIPALYKLSSSAYEAYKNGFNHGKNQINKYLEIPTALNLIVNEYGHSYSFLKSKKFRYDIITFLNPLQKEIGEGTKDTTYAFLNKAFCDKRINENPIFKITVDECEQFYSDLCNKYQDHCKENYIAFNKNDVQIWFQYDLIQSYIKTIDNNSMQAALAILHNYDDYSNYNSRITENNFRKAAIIILLAYYVSHAETVYQGVHEILRTLSKYNKIAKCALIFNDLVSIPIDNEKYSFYILYLIYKRNVQKIFMKIKCEIDVVDISRVSISLKFDINNLSDYVVLRKDHSYSIYELD